MGRIGRTYPSTAYLPRVAPSASVGRDRQPHRRVPRQAVAAAMIGLVLFLGLASWLFSSR